MFCPKLGVSLKCLVDDVTPQTFQKLGESPIVTFELDPKPFEDDPKGRKRAAAKEHLAGRVASVHAKFGRVLDISCLDEAGRKKAVDCSLEAIGLASEFGTPILVQHASAEPINPDDRPVRIAQARKSLAQIFDRARNASVKVAVELLPRTCLGNSPAELREIINGFGPTEVGICLDVNHLMDQYAQLPGLVRQLGSDLTTLHLSDYDGVDEKHWMPGKGVINWEPFLLALEEINYQGPFNYEANPEASGFEGRVAEYCENFEWMMRQRPER